MCSRSTAAVDVRDIYDSGMKRKLMITSCIPAYLIVEHSSFRTLLNEFASARQLDSKLRR